MASSSLSALKSKLENLISGPGKDLLLDAANTEISSLQDTLNGLLATTGIQLSGASISETGEGSFTVDGTADLLGASNVAIAATFTGSTGSFVMSVTISNSSALTLDLSSVAGKVLPSETLPVEFNSIPITRISATLNTCKKSLSLNATTGNWKLPLGDGLNNVADGSLSLTTSLSSGSVEFSGSITADATVAGNKITVEFQIQKGNTVLTGGWSSGSATLSDLAETVGVTLPALPGGSPALGMKSACLTVDFSTPSVKFVGQSTGFGEAVLLVTKSNSWQAAFGVAFPAGWKPSDLSRELEAMDVFAFESAAVVVSTYEDKNFSFPGFKPLCGKTFEIIPGLTLAATAELTTGAIAGNLNSLIQKETIFVTGTFGTHLSDLTLTVGLEGPPLVIPPDGSAATNVSLTDPRVELIASPFKVALVGDVNIPLDSTQKVVVEGSLAISTTRASLTIDAKMPSIDNPLSFRGVSLEEIGATVGIVFVPFGVDVGLEAVFKLGDTPANTFATDLEFIPAPPAVIPRYLYGTLSELSLPLIFKTLIDSSISLPAELSSVTLTDFKCYWAKNTTRLPDGTTIDAGFGLAGTLDIAGFELTGNVNVDAQKGISGKLDTSAVNLHSIGGGKYALSVTGRSQLGGPTVAFNTAPQANVPYVKATLDLEFFGVAALAVDGSISKESLAIVINGNTPDIQNWPAFVSGSLSVATTRSSFAAKAALSTKLNVKTPNIPVPGTGYHLGSVRINTDFSGAASFSVSESSFSLGVQGTFNGQRLPSLEISSLASLSDLPDEIVTKIGDEAHTAFSYLFSDAKTWLESIASGVIQDAGSVETIAEVLVNVFHQSAEEVARLLHRILGTGLTDLVEALNAVGISASEVVTILANDLGFGLSSVESAVASVFQSFHVDSAALHSDTNVPHADLGKHHADLGHVDHGTFLGHADSNALHVDTTTPHVDTGGHVDVGHVDQHVDVS